MRKIRALFDFKVLSLQYECTILVTKLPREKAKNLGSGRKIWVFSTPEGEASCSPV